MATLTIEVPSSAKQSLQLQAAEVDLPFDGYLSQLIQHAAEQRAVAFSSDEADQRPWRGVFAPARIRQPFFTFEVPVPADGLPKHAPNINMNWHRIEPDDE